MTHENWKIAEGAADWQCDWESAKRFQLRYFRSLPMVDKIRAVEDLCRLARALRRHDESRDDSGPAS
ncbi:MAG: hypothetical protein Q7W56_08610 [Candidatus Latescibacteria bacterium]|nr:hypothetical protein [Candidatus Latescibacterota bacterium]